MTPVNKSRLKQSPQKQPSQKSVNNNSTVVMIIIAISIIVLVLLGYFFGYPLVKKHFFNRSTTIIQETVTVDTPEIEETQIVTQQESNPSIPKGYYIIVGSFRNKVNAEQMVRMNDAINLNVLYFESLGRYRVTAGYFENIREAYNKIYKVKDVFGTENAWVLEYF